MIKTEDLIEKHGNGITCYLQEDVCGCALQDVVMVPLAPVDVERIKELAEQMAMKTDCYNEQGMWRELRTVFINAHEGWKKCRDSLKEE